MLRKRTALLFHNVCRSIHRQTSEPILDSCSSTNTFSSKNVSRKIPSLLNLRKYSSSSEKSDNNEAAETNKLQAGIGKYKVFADFDSPVILDIDEERQLRLENPELFEQEEEKPDEFIGMNLESNNHTF